MKWRSVLRICTGLKLSGEFLEAEFRTLSGGEKTLACLAKVLLQNPDILVLDEPFAGLDAQTLWHAAEALRRYRRGRAVVLVSHETEKLFPDWHTLSL